MWKFIAELVTRLFGKTPWFFKVIQIISAIIAVVMLGPDILKGIESGGLELPDTWSSFVAKAVGIAAAVSTVIAQLPVTTSVKEDKNIPD